MYIICVKLCGINISPELITQIQDRIDSQPELSCVQLAHQLCNWLDWRNPKGKHKEVSCRKMLPTEAEWKYAARGGLVGNDYPGGAEIDTTHGNFTFKGISRGTVPVGSYAANGFGLFDMSGNVVEWTADFYEKEYYKSSPLKNPAGPQSGKFRVIQGGGWHSGPFCNRVYFRNALPANWLDINVGFRCA